ncbi:MAG TPA: quinolinate synthase NadA [Candidatus Eisenbacteria bacterium]|uniref:Quinolinate synthase n=1 Tax=Eiseniibacteriota bacterium TaxID=2212470 RepID=A0A7V2AU37_UNCEI|nr:quinolinate synthase NadA [Candidatus Eisenbacteria bacterium]
MPKDELIQRIERLKRERGAVILAHNYQPPEIQDIADRLGDSLDLSRIAQREERGVIVFCGVRFMAETAAILSPEKRVILPDPTAGCPMADMLSLDDLLSLREEHPGAEVVMYVNSTAEVKAHTDICCTSANAVAVVESVPDGREIIFGPDQYLGGWVQRQTERRMIIWRGFCPSHQKIIPAHIEELRERYPDAVVMVHPEVHPEISRAADAVLGTGGMIRYAGESRAETFIVGTEVGMVYRLSKLYPEKRFIAASRQAICPNMKKITLEKVLSSLETLEPAVSVPDEIADRARRAIERMIEIG